MGTDIHLVTQIRQPDGTWVDREPQITCPKCKGTKVAMENAKFDQVAREWIREGGPFEVPCSRCADWGQPGHPSTGVVGNYSDRNYDVFAVLANVRNGRGFAGCVTGTGFNIISEPRGLPEDFEVADDYMHGEDPSKKRAPEAPYDPYAPDNGKWMGDHSHSWLTLRELLDFEWDQKTHHTGWISLAQYIKWREHKGFPDTWSGGISGQGIQHLDMDQAEKLLAELPEDSPHRDVSGPLDFVKPDSSGTSYYVRVIWESTYADSMGNFLDMFVEGLKQMAADLNLTPDDIRIVFGFDS